LQTLPQENVATIGILLRLFFHNKFRENRNHRDANRVYNFSYLRQGRFVRRCGYAGH